MATEYLGKISPADFEELASQLVGLDVSQSRRGAGSAVLLDLGRLTDVPLLKGGVGREGQATVMIDWSWRVEGPRSVRFGSWSGDTKISNGIASLAGSTVTAIAVEGRLPELMVEFDKRLRIRSFTTVEGQPEWTLFLLDGSWLRVARGGVIRERGV